MFYPKTHFIEILLPCSGCGSDKAEVQAYVSDAGASLARAESYIAGGSVYSRSPDDGDWSQDREVNSEPGYYLRLQKALRTGARFAVGPGGTLIIFLCKTCGQDQQMCDGAFAMVASVAFTDPTMASALQHYRNSYENLKNAQTVLDRYREEVARAQSRLAGLLEEIGKKIGKTPALLSTPSPDSK